MCSFVNVKIYGLIFHLYGYQNAEGDIRLKEATKYSAESVIFPSFITEHDIDAFLTQTMKYYNAKLRKDGVV